MPSQLLVNPGFESGNLSPWTQRVSSGVDTGTGVYSGDTNSGTYAWRVIGSMNQNFNPVLTQSVTIKACHLYTMSVAAKQTFNQCSMVLSVGEQLVGRFYPTGTWQTFTYTFGTGLLGAGIKDVVVGADCSSGIVGQNTFIDDITLIS
jgi:hypothetical protein